MSTRSYTKGAGRGKAKNAGLATGPEFSEKPKIAPRTPVSELKLPNNLTDTIISPSDNERVVLYKRAKIQIEMQIKQILYTNNRVNQVLDFYGLTRPDVMWAVYYDCQRQFEEIGMAPIKLFDLPELVNISVPRLLAKRKALVMRDFSTIFDKRTTKKFTTHVKYHRNKVSK